MRTFKDNLNQQWSIELTLGKIHSLRERLHLDLFRTDHYLQMLNSLTDRITFVFVLCEEQAKRLEVSPEEFENRLKGDGYLHQASLAFLGETERLFQEYGMEAQAMMARKAIESMKANQNRLSELLTSGEFSSALDSLTSAIMPSVPTADGNGSTVSEQSADTPHHGT